MFENYDFVTFVIVTYIASRYDRNWYK